MARAAGTSAGRASGPDGLRYTNSIATAVAPTRRSPASRIAASTRRIAATVPRRLSSRTATAASMPLACSSSPQTRSMARCRRRRLEDLADGRHRHLRDDLDAHRHRRSLGDASGGELAQVLGRGSRPVPQHDVGHRNLAGVRVRLADCGRQHDVRVFAQALLDHLRIDVVTAADDQVLGAPCEPQVAVLVIAARSPELNQRWRSAPTTQAALSCDGSR